MRRAGDEWWSRIFEQNYLDTYGPMLTPERTEGEVESLIRTFSLQPPARILDVACGQGRHAIAFARRGFDVVGADLSAPLLEVASARTREAGLTIAYVRSDMRQIPFTDEFDVVVNLFTAFGYFEEEGEHRRALAAFVRALRGGGRLVLEMINRDGLIPRFQASQWEALPDGTLVLNRHEFDSKRGRLYTERTLRRPGQPDIDHSHSVRLFPSEELVRLFEVSGLTDVELFEGFQLTDGQMPAPLRPYSMQSRRVCVTGRKPG